MRIDTTSRSTVSRVVALLGLLLLLSGRLRAQEVVVGVNVVNPMRDSVAGKNAVFDRLESAHVRVIRCGISNDDKGIDYAKRAQAKGIRILREQYSAFTSTYTLPPKLVLAEKR